MLPNLSDEEWDDICKRLVLHAHFRMKQRSWRGVPMSQGGVAPGAVEADDIASAALTDVLQGRRPWNGDSYPIFFDFLKSVVDSKISHLASSVQNRVERRGDGEQFSQLMARENVSDEADFRKVLTEAIHKDELGAQIFECIAEGIERPAEIATKLGINVNDVYNAQKRLRRLINEAAAIWRSKE